MSNDVKTNADLDKLNILPADDDIVLLGESVTVEAAEPDFTGGITIQKTPSTLITPEREVQYTPSEDSGIMDASDILKLTDGVTLCERFVLGKILVKTENCEIRFSSDTHTDTTVTVHIPSESIQKNAAEITQMKRGYEAIAALNHPHIVPLVGTFNDVNFGFFVVRKYVPGKTLNEYRRDYIRANGRFPLLQAIRFLTGIAGALDYANRCGVVHRDLKPANIIISPESGVLVANFLLPFESTMHVNSPYISAEEKWDNYVHAKSNQYTFAIIAYEFIAGKQRVLTVDADFTPLRTPDMPQPLIDVIHRATSKVPDERYESCSAFVADLAAAEREIAQQAEATKVHRQNQMFPALVGAAAAAVVLVAVALVWLFLQPSGNKPVDSPIQQVTEKTPNENPPAIAIQQTENKEQRNILPEPKSSDSELLAEANRLKRKNPSTEEKVPQPAETKTAEPAERDDNPADIARRKAEEKRALMQQDLQNHQRGEKLPLTIGDGSYVFVWIPPCPEGFLMGSPANEPKYDSIETLHTVVLTRGFYLLETEVTQKLWSAVMPLNPSNSFGTQNLPVENVTWNDCQSFIVKLNTLKVVPSGYQFSLPTESQWEYACRSGTRTPFSFGYALDGSQANCDGTLPYDASAPDGVGIVRGVNINKPQPVKSYPPNSWGLYDMHGNVWEWCADWFGEYPAGTIEDPSGAASGTYRIRRGGGWGRSAEYCRSANRRIDYPDASQNRCGLRLAIVPVPGK